MSGRVVQCYWTTLFFLKTVALHTLGCKLNYAETSSIGKQFRERGYTVVEPFGRSDVFVLNTCSVTERADRECRQLIRRVRRMSPEAYIIVMGCYAQLKPGTIAAIEGVDLVLGANEKFNLFEFADPERRSARPKVHVSPVSEVVTIGPASSSDSHDRTRAFLKIQDGCDYHCTFCTIPLARGASRSIPEQELVSQARDIALQGYREIVLTGVNVGDYGRKIGTNLLSLLKSLVAINGIDRIRVSSIEPNLLSKELLDFWLEEDKLCKHFHIPLQSGSDTILKLMSRRYQTDRYSRLVSSIRSRHNDAGIGADVLVGFPGETPELFEEGYAFLRELPLSYIHVFTYSERPNTAATELPKSVEPRIRAERSERLRQLGVRKRRVFNETFVGRTLNVLFEHGEGTDLWSGLTEHYVRVLVHSRDSLAHQTLPVLITGVRSDVCLGRVSNKHEDALPAQSFSELVHSETV